MRQSQKTETKADHQGKIGLEVQQYPGARSGTAGEGSVWRDTGRLQARILSNQNLEKARKRVRKNKGVAGIDGMTVQDLTGYLIKHGDELKAQLEAGTYRPKPVKRVEILKPNGRMRKLGIPTVVDRMVQQMVAQVLGPIYERCFSDNSYGFRPKRSAHDAVQRCIELYDQGYHYVVDLDLKAYFDTVNHDMLMRFLKYEITDEWTLRLIRKFLTSGAVNGQMFELSEQGTPQGGPISPLLANVYLHELDKELTRRGHEFVRYADDCNIFVKSRRAGERVLASISDFLEKKLKLTVNREKSRVVAATKMEFLGFSLWKGASSTKARLTKKAKQRIKAKLKELTKRNRGGSLTQILDEIKTRMIGWLNYYGISSMKSFITGLDKWLRARIRQLLWKRWKRPKTRIRELQRLGFSRRKAYIYANP